MSTDYGFYCGVCDSNSPLESISWKNIKGIWVDRHLIVGIDSISRALTSEVTVKFDLYDRCLIDLIEWITKHKDHHRYVSLIDEYGKTESLTE